LIISNLILAHHAAVTLDVGRQDNHELASDALLRNGATLYLSVGTANLIKLYEILELQDKLRIRSIEINLGYHVRCVFVKIERILPKGENIIYSENHRFV